MSKEIKKKGPSLLEIIQASKILQEKLIDSGGEITEDISKELTSNLAELENKALAYAYTIKDIDSQLDDLKDMEAQIKARKRALSNAKDRLNNILLQGLEVNEVEKIEGSTHRITVGKKRGYPNYYNYDIIPEEYRSMNYYIKTDENSSKLLEVILDSYKNTIPEDQIEKEEAIDKKRILEDLKAGKDIAGVEFINDEKQLYIK